MQHLLHSIPRYSLSIFLKIDESSFFFFPFFYAFISVSGYSQIISAGIIVEFGNGKKSESANQNKIGNFYPVPWRFFSLETRLARILRTITDLQKECRHLNKWLSKTKANWLPSQLSSNYPCWRQFWSSCCRTQCAAPDSIDFSVSIRKRRFYVTYASQKCQSVYLLLSPNNFHDNCRFSIIVATFFFQLIKINDNQHSARFA